jgi:hypothetical protein
MFVFQAVIAFALIRVPALTELHTSKKIQTPAIGPCLSEYREGYPGFLLNNKKIQSLLQ